MPNPPAKDPFAAIGAALPDFDDGAAKDLTLREIAKGDPPKGCPMNVARPGDEEALIWPGKWEAAGFVDYRTGLPANCPVTPLGKLMDTFFFLDTLGEVHTLAANAGKGHIDALFAGRNRYLLWAWPQWVVPKNPDDPPTVNNWKAEEARQALFAACAYKGTFELEDRVRGRGAWRDDDGGLIYHAGDAVWIGGQWRQPGEHGRFIYPGRPKIGRPARRYEDAGEGSPGDLVLQGLQSWNWERGELDARLALGWLMTALIGGALTQRPVAYVVGGEGTGKSTLQALFRHMMNGALRATSNTTQAGIYQQVKQDSIAVMVDEMEAKADTRTTDKIIELARIAYSGDKMSRGGDKGIGQQFSIYSSFLFSSIALPAMSSADASRMALLMLRERERLAPGEPAAEVLAALGLRDAKIAMAIGRALLKRLFVWFEIEGGVCRWDALVSVFRRALVKAGHEDRAADTFATLAAGCHVALADAMAGEADAMQWADWLNPLSLAETADREKTWQRCWWHMMEARPEALKQAHHKTLGDAVLAAREAGHDDPGDLAKTAAILGMAISRPRGEPPTFEHFRLFVPLKSAALCTLFQGSDWAGRPGAPGPWGGVLRQMPKGFYRNQTCNQNLNRAQAGLMINLIDVVGAAGAKEE